jgi:ferrous iron transport protein A
MQPLATPTRSRGVRPLSSLGPGELARVVSLEADGFDRGRLLDLGFTPGAGVECLFSSPMGDPTAYRVRGAIVALRRGQSEKILVTAPYGPSASGAEP